MNDRAPRALSRRDVVVLGASIVAGSVVVCIVGCARGRSGSAAATELVLPTTFSEIESLRAVGKKYLELHPEETLERLLAELQPRRGFAALDLEIREQFAAGDVVRVAGWVLARTEARVCGVVALRG